MQKEYAQIVHDAALEAGRIIMEYYKGGFSVEQKEDLSPVTEADKAADKLIRQFLKETGLPVISEESSLESYEKRKDWKKVWIVDPLDGTKEYIKRTGEFTINIALVEEGYPVGGLVFAPALGLLYRTDESGLLKEELEQDEKGLFHNARGCFLWKTEIFPGNLCASVSHQDKTTQGFIQRYRSSYPQGEVLSAGSSLKFCMMAEGKASVYPRFSPTMEWDTAAGHALLIQSGGDVLYAENGVPLRYNKENMANGPFIALGAGWTYQKASAFIPN
ncbi:MAG: 3'(2'),5'-bisphosphate nucleotidase CysQ [Flavobacteriales bacterium]|nr:3'(2'),5'-bisphosphate nucleotidase CysQ [Flavobacteriales bacterium]